MYSVLKALLWAEPPVKSPVTETRGASTAFTLWFESVLADQGELIQQHGRQGGVDVQIYVVFVVLAVVASGCQRLSAHALVLSGPVLVAVLRISGVAIVELARRAQAELGVARGRGDVGLEEAGGISGCGRDGGVYNRIQILFRAVKADQKAAFGDEADGPGGAAFVDAPLLEGLGRSQRILCVQGRVAEVEIEFAVVMVGGGLGDDFHLSAAGPVILGGIGVLVDADFLHSRGGDGGAVGLGTVDNQARAAGSRCTVIEEGAHGTGVVVVKDGQRLQVARRHHGGVVIVLGRG